jgi:hypothetical protein
MHPFLTKQTNKQPSFIDRLQLLIIKKRAIQKEHAKYSQKAIFKIRSAKCFLKIGGRFSIARIKPSFFNCHLSIYG